MLGDVPFSARNPRSSNLASGGRVWVARGGADPALADLGGALRELRRDQSPFGAVSISDSSSRRSSPACLSGSALRRVGQGIATFVINLRTDDGPLLELPDPVRIGTSRRCEAGRAVPAALSWRVGRLADAASGGVVRQVSAAGRAAGVYAAWRELVRSTSPWRRRPCARAECLAAPRRVHAGAPRRSQHGPHFVAGPALLKARALRRVRRVAPNARTRAPSRTPWQAPSAMARRGSRVSDDRAQPPDRHAKVWRRGRLPRRTKSQASEPRP